MWIQVRTMDGKQSVQLDDGLSKLTKIEEIRELLAEKFDVEPDRQRLFFSGKQLENGHTLFDYNVGLNGLIQVMFKPPCVEEKLAEKQSPVKENGIEEDKLDETLHNGKTDEVNNNVDSDPSTSANKESQEEIKAAFKVGDLIDAKDKSMGAWFEGNIVKLSENEGQVIFHVVFDDYDQNEILKLNEKDVRPRARTILTWDQIYEGQMVMANYNPDEPKERGFWYDATITRKLLKRNNKELYGKLLLGKDDTASQECKIIFVKEIFKIEKTGENVIELKNGDMPERRKVKPDCDECKDHPSKPCKECSCHVCGGKHDPDKQIMCDECDMAYHLTCLNPPMDALPEDDEWYCHLCKNDPSQIVRLGEKLKASKKKAKMPSATNTSKRDWGKGMACCGRTKVCTIVPTNHYGHIPGIPVGSLWRFRLQVSEVGIHRPPVAGIHGKEHEGAFSLVLAGGYEDDLDNGDEFYYTGSGGRDLSGNKRTAEQSCDQKLTKMNKALAKNCNAELSESGGEAINWKKGKAVRVVRSSKFRKHSKYAPEEGVRYDGIYKIVKYWPEKGQSGFLVWRYFLRRDDESPAPWTQEGKKIIEELGLTIQYPDGYLEAQAQKEKNKEKGKGFFTPAKENGKRKRKDSDSPPHSPTKKSKYSLPDRIICSVEADNKNKKVWKELTENPESYQKFLSNVEEKFLCICCQEVVFEPVTTVCKHNLCKGCLDRSYKAGVETCPVCRHSLGQNHKLTINSALDKILRVLFPGYEAGR